MGFVTDERDGWTECSYDGYNNFYSFGSILYAHRNNVAYVFGEQITQKGIGNGISLIIFAGIVSGIPSAIGNTIRAVNSGAMELYCCFSNYRYYDCYNFGYYLC